MKKETGVLKVSVLLIGIGALILFIVLSVFTGIDAGNGSTKMAFVLYGILFMVFLSAIPFYASLYKAYILLRYIDMDKAFSQISVKALESIKKYSLLISLIYLACLPLLYVVAEVDDATGIILFGVLIIFASIIVSVFAAVLCKLLKKALEIKNENELTI